MRCEQKIRQYLADLDQKGLIRSRHLGALASDIGIDFCSNDYLALSNSPMLQKGFMEGYKKYPSGSGASALIAGYHPIHHELEAFFTASTATDTAMIFSSGYAANLAVMGLLGKLQCPTLIDKSAHASIYDGLHLANIPYGRFFHQNYADMQEKLKDGSVIVTEGIFSMSGSISDLPIMVNGAKRKDSVVIVDEAHSFGIVGEQGMGAAHAAAIALDDIPLRIFPLGKSVGSMGAIVAGKKEWMEALLQAARPYMYSTAVSPAVAYGIKEAMKAVIKAHAARVRLQSLIAHFKRRRASSHLDWLESDTPIQRIKIKSVLRAKKLHQALLAQSIKTQYIRPPTVNKLETGLRICLRADHTPSDIDALFEALALIHERDSLEESVTWE